MKPQHQRFFARVDEVTQWLIAQPGRCFKDWPRETVFFYVAFHALCGTIFVVRVNDKVQAVMFAEPRPLAAVSAPFRWEKPAGGECVMVWDLVGARRHIAALWRKFHEKFPAVNRYFAYRKRKLVEFPKTKLMRFAYV